MRILSHRGLWREAAAKNTRQAFRDSFRLGFGVETDVRDFMGDLVISHDPPAQRDLSLAEFLSIAREFADADRMPLAINIKADGLARPIAQTLRGHPNPWFVFDMSVPDMVQHAKIGNPIYARLSELETLPQHGSILSAIAGVWLDGFWSTWYGADTVRGLRGQGLAVCVVSPELHARDSAEARALWLELTQFRNDNGVMLCTDWPEDARRVLS